MEGATGTRRGWRWRRQNRTEWAWTVNQNPAPKRKDPASLHHCDSPKQAGGGEQTLSLVYTFGSMPTSTPAYVRIQSNLDSGSPRRNLVVLQRVDVHGKTPGWLAGRRYRS